MKRLGKKNEDQEELGGIGTKTMKRSETVFNSRTILDPPTRKEFQIIRSQV